MLALSVNDAAVLSLFIFIILSQILRTPTAKRPLAKETLTLAGDINAKSDFPRGKSLVFRTTDSDWDGNMPSEYAAYAKLRSALSGSYDMWFGASDCRFWFCTCRR
ncbi:MAG: hypothetical protein ACLR4Z_01095 [Butyricicoccaceae bacterium]